MLKKFLNSHEKLLDKLKNTMYNMLISTERKVNSMKNTIFTLSDNRITLSMEFACTAV